MELIIKEGLQIDVDDTPLLDLRIVANRKGYIYLSRYFDWLANREAYLSTAPDGDPDDHQHLDFPKDPFDSKLSDRFTFRFGLMTARNREAVFECYGISEKTAKRGSVVGRFREFIKTVKRCQKILGWKDT